MRVKLVIPADHRVHKHEKKQAFASVHGEHYAYHGQSGTILCGAGKGGAWVRFDGQGDKYVGCPVAWLEKI